jgi:hypothetical protein
MATTTLTDAIDAEMAALVPIGPGELAEHLRQVLSEWNAPDTIGLQQAVNALARYDRQQYWRDAPPWLVRRKK